MRQDLKEIASFIIDAFDVDMQLYMNKVVRQLKNTENGMKFAAWAEANPMAFESFLRLIGYSDEIGRSFRFKSATCSDSNRPAVLMQIGHPVGAKRRWFLVLSHNNVIKSSRNVFFS